MGIPENHPAIRQAVERGLIPPAAGPAKPKGRARTLPAVATAAGPRWAVTLAVPCRVVSEANRRDHWTVKRRRAEIQRFALVKAFDRSPVVINAHQWHRALPFVVTWAHLGRVMDSDNLAIAFKALRDELARLVIVDDGDPRVTWRYDQRPGEPGVELRIEGGAGG